MEFTGGQLSKTDKYDLAAVVQKKEVENLTSGPNAATLECPCIQTNFSKRTSGAVPGEHYLKGLLGRSSPRTWERKPSSKERRELLALPENDREGNTKFNFEVERL